VLPHADGVKTLVLKDVTGLSIRDSSGLQDANPSGKVQAGSL
jgi:hypothetical protein